MKILLCFILLSGISYVSCISTTLSWDLNQIAALVPVQDLFQIFQPNKFDPASHAGSNYVASTAFQNSMYILFKHPNMKQLKNYFERNGIDINELFLKITIDKERSPQRSIQPIERRTIKLTTFIEHAYSISQMENIISLVIHKTATSPAFRHFYNLLNGLNHNKIYADMINVPRIKEMVVSLNQVGINTKEVWRALSYLFGWDKVTNIITLEEYEFEEETRDPEESPLFQILRQYLNLIPKEKFIFLYRGLLVNPLFQEIVVFIFNKQYVKIIEKIGENPQIDEFFDYLESEGVSFVKLLDLMRDRLGFTFAYYRIPTGKFEENSHSFSLVQFLEIAKQILPVNEIRKLTTSLMQTSNEYRVLTDKIMNLVFSNNLHLYFENQLEIRNTAMQYGFDINKILNLIFFLIGVEYKMPAKGTEFTESIYELIELFPKADYVELYHKYKNDTNIWKMVSYLKGPRFAEFTEAFFSTVELKILINFLSKQYVPFKAILIDVFDRLGIMQWWINYDYFCASAKNKCIGVLNSNSENLNNFVKERTDLFPFKDILLLFHSKLESSHYFQNLFIMLSKLDGANLFKKITEHDVLRDFFVKVSKVGYNVRGITQHLSQLFGWGNVLMVDLSLNQTIENFENMIYRKELFKIFDKYPDEVQQVKQFFKNSAFMNTMEIFANVPAIKNIITWMQNLNVPVISYYNYYFGQETPKVYQLKLDTQLKWKEFTDDIVNFLKKNRFFDFSVSQKYNSIEFHAFLEKILFLDNKIISELVQYPDTHYVIDKLFSTGINLLDVLTFLEDVKNDAYELHKS